MTASAAVRPTAAGCRLAVRVVPRARRTAIEGLRGDALLVRLAAPPVDGAANLALVELLASVLSVPRTAILVVSGAHHRNKRVEVTGCSAEVAVQRLGLARAL